MRHKVCRGSVACWEGIFYIQGVSHVCLKLLAFPSTRQKKTAIGLKIAVIMGMQDIKSFNVSDHPRTYCITHHVKPYWRAGYLKVAHFFKGWKAGVDIVI